MSDKMGTDFTAAEFEFRNTASENILEDELVKRVMSKVAGLKGEITRALTKAKKTAVEVAKHKDSGITTGNLLLKGLVIEGAGYIEKADTAREKLDDAITLYIRILAEITIKYPDLEAKTNELIDKQEKALEDCEDRIREVKRETMLQFENFGSTAPNSREASPVRGKRFLNMKHLLPSVLNEECSTRQYKKFKRDFEIWVQSSYPDGIEETTIWGTLNSRLDAAWQEKMYSIEGIEKCEIDKIWEEMDKIMIHLFPTHLRRMKFLAEKPTKSQMPSSFINLMKDQSTDAQIGQLTKASLILHLTVAGLAHSELNKSVKAMIIEALRVNPNQTDLTRIITKIKGLEADYNANGDKNAIRAVNHGKEYMCKLCNNTHGRGECSITCRHCKKSGSHKDSDCWKKFGKPGDKKDKRDRSVSTERKSKNSGRRQKHKKSPTRARKTRDSEPETDRDSDARTDTDTDETPPKDDRKSTTRKVKSILRKVRRIKSVNNETLTLSASSLHKTEALTGSGLRTINSSEDSDSDIEDDDQETRARKLLQAYKKRIKVRRIKSRSDNSATMYGRIRSECNRKEKFVADSGTGIPIIPIEIAKAHGLTWKKVDSDEPGCESASGHDMEVVGQCSFWVKFDNMKHQKKISGLVAEQAGQEILIDLDLLVEWTILPKDFPNPMDPKERETKARKVTVKDAKKSAPVIVQEKVGSERSSMCFNDQSDHEYDSNKLMEELREKLLKEFSEVFKTELSKEDRIKIDPVKVETVMNYKSFKPVNRMTPIETPLHLQPAAKKELQKMMNAGFLEECKAPTDYCSRAFFVAKPNSDNLKARMVADFRSVNKILRRPGYPMEGSALILKKLNPDEGYFCTIDLSSGYHQIEIHEDSRDLFAIILPSGKFRFTVLPQGTSSSCDIFNIITDQGIRNVTGYHKNIDDILTTRKSMPQMEERLRNLLTLCREKNIKLNPNKFNIGHEVQFGGVDLKGIQKSGDSRRRVYMAPAERRLEEFLAIKPPQHKKDVLRIIGLACQLKN